MAHPSFRLLDKEGIFHLFPSRDKDVPKDATSDGRASFYGGAHHFGRAADA